MLTAPAPSVRKGATGRNELTGHDEEVLLLVVETSFPHDPDGVEVNRKEDGSRAELSTYCFATLPGRAVPAATVSSSPGLRERLHGGAQHLRALGNRPSGTLHLVAGRLLQETDGVRSFGTRTVDPRESSFPNQPFLRMHSATFLNLLESDVNLEESNCTDLCRVRVMHLLPPSRDNADYLRVVFANGSRDPADVGVWLVGSVAAGAEGQAEVCLCVSLMKQTHPHHDFATR